MHGNECCFNIVYLKSIIKKRNKNGVCSADRKFCPLGGGGGGVTVLHHLAQPNDVKKK